MVYGRCGPAQLRLDPIPPAPSASDNLISPLEGAFSFAIFTLLLLLSGVLPHGVLQSRPPILSNSFTITQGPECILDHQTPWLSRAGFHACEIYWSTSIIKRADKLVLRFLEIRVRADYHGLRSDAVDGCNIIGGFGSRACKCGYGVSEQLRVAKRLPRGCFGPPPEGRIDFGIRRCC